MRIGERVIDSTSPPYVIAELGVNHDGSVERALDLVRAAKSASADAIKLQLFETDRLLSRAAKLAAYQRSAGETDPFAMLRSLELTIDQMRPIVSLAHALGMHAIVTVFSMELVATAEQLLWDAYKTASPDVINRPLLDALGSTGKPMLVSAGAATLDEVRQASEWMHGRPHVLFQCVSSYPTPEHAASIAGRQAMMVVSPWSLGYSDHTMAVDTGALAVASGATVLEKHLTHDRSAKGPDHAASLDPDGFADYVRLAHRAHVMLGSPSKVVHPLELDVRTISRQSVTTTRPLEAGETLSRSDLTIKRPGSGLPPNMLEGLPGRLLKRSVQADAPLSAEDLA